MKASTSITIPIHVHLADCADLSVRKLVDDFFVLIEAGDTSASVKLSHLFDDCVMYAGISDNYMDLAEVERLRAVARRAEAAALEIEGKFLSAEASFAFQREEITGLGKKTLDHMVSAGADVLLRAGMKVPPLIIRAVYDAMVTTGAKCIDNQLKELPGWMREDDEVQS